MSMQENKDLIRRAFATFDEQQNMAALNKFTAPDYIAHFPGVPGPLDREGMKQFGNSFYAAFPGLRHQFEEVIAEGDKVAVRMMVRGIHTASLIGPGGTIPPTNKQMAISAMNIFRVEDGKVVEHWAEFDMLGMLQQLGIIPPPEAAPV
jgi:predicted ester cyclase